MAEKVILTDKDNKSYMPITRGELVLDSSGNQAFKSDSFLATTDHHGLLSANDKAVIDSLNNTLDELERKAGYAYDFINATISDQNDSNTTIDRLREIFDLLDGISETDTLKSLVEKNLGENYLPLSGGIISNAAHGPLTIERTSTNTAAIKFKNTSGILGSIGMNSINGDLLIYNSNATQYRTILDSSNSSVSKSGNTLTVTIGGVSENLTIPDTQDTWRDITDSVSTTSSDISASASAVKTAYEKAVEAYNLANGKTSNTGTVTKISTGVGLSGGDITTTGTIKCNLHSDTSLGTLGTTTELYAVGVDSLGKLCVNVPQETYNVATTSAAGLMSAADKIKLDGMNASDFAAVSHTHTKSQITDFPSIGNGTVTIKQNGTSKGSFTLNQSRNATIELTDTVSESSDTKVTQNNSTSNYGYRVLLSGGDNDNNETTTANKSSGLRFNPYYNILTVPNVSNSDILAFSGQNGIYFQYANDATKSIVLSATAFKPFTNSHEKLSLGDSSSRWANIYSKSGNFTDQITSQVKTGTPPFHVDSTDVNENLNADMVDGYNISVVSSLPFTKTNNTIYILI